MPSIAAITACDYSCFVVMFFNLTIIKFLNNPDHATQILYSTGVK